MAATKDENVQSSEKPFIIENNVIIGKKKPLDSKYTSSGKCLYDLMKNNPSVVSQVDPITGKEDTIGQLLDRAVRCALWLKKEGVRKGDIIAIVSHNSRYSFTPCLAALFIGAAFNPWDPGMNTCMTELGGAATYQAPSDTAGSCGTVSVNYEFKIIDLQLGEALGPNQQGEVCVRSEFMMKGYYKNPTATKEAIDEDGWIHSGDLAYYNENGELFIVDRIKEILKYRGYQISPSAIENLLQSHPAVLEVAVVGIPHPTDDEHPVAFIHKMPDKEVSAEELMMMVEKNFGDAYKLRGGVKFVPNFPYTNSGKISRVELRNIAKSSALL